jgi:hypothetical protein
MSLLNTWSNLSCACGSEKFIPLLELRWTDGGGTVQTPKGFRCAGCGIEMDAAKLVAELKLRQKKKEYEQLQEELGPK